jgi:hypothetical protein
MSQEETETNETEATEVDRPQITMSWRELAGAINRAKHVCVYVCWGPGEDGEDYYQISKEAARKISEHAHEADIRVTVSWDKRDLLIGPCDEQAEDEGPEDEDAPDEDAPDDEDEAPDGPDDEEEP